MKRFSSGPIALGFNIVMNIQATFFKSVLKETKFHCDVHMAYNTTHTLINTVTFHILVIQTAVTHSSST